MPDPIHLTVQGDEAVQLTAEELRVVEAVSPTVTTEQIEGGAVITVTDLHGVHAVTVYNGADGRGIANAVLNSDYTLTITYTDSTSYTTPSIRGAQGRGIMSITKIGSSGLVDAYMITYTDGDPSMFYVTNGADGISPTVEVAPITGGYRITITDKNGAHSFDLMNGVNGISPAVITQSITGGNRVTITDAEHPAGQSFDVMDGEPGQAGPGVPTGGASGQVLKKSSATDYDTEWGDPQSVPVQDVQVDGASVLSNGVANVPRAGLGTDYGVIKLGSGLGLGFSGAGNLMIATAVDAAIKNGTNSYTPITPYNQEKSTFYGLAKAAGDSTQSASSNAVGTYTDSAIDKILAMLGVDALIGPHEGATASEDKSIGDVFIFSGKLYKATDSIASGAAIVPGTNCTQTNLINLIRGM